MTVELIKFESPELNSIEASKADKIRATFAPMAAMLKQFESEFDAVVAESEEEITRAVTAKAKRLRLDIGKVRIAAEKVRKAEKEEYLRAGKAIDGVSNILKWAVEDKETRLKEIENHFEIMERQRLEALQSERETALSVYVDDAHERDLSSMEADVWDAYYAAKKKEYEDRLEAERQAEAERVAREKAEAEERERIRKENERLRKEAEERARAEKAEAEKRAREEAERRAKEAEEQKRRDEAARKEREAHEAELRKEAAERARLQAELDRQKAERERAEKEQRARNEAEERARLQAEKAAQNKAHRAKVNRTAVAALIAKTGMTEDQARGVVCAVVGGAIPNMYMQY